MDRTCSIEAKGEIDEKAGEFWVSNPFEMLRNGENLSAYERNRLFLNTSDTRFFEASHGSNTDIDSDSRGVIPADFDQDGDEDLLVISAGGGALRLFLNQMPQQNRLKLLLRGTGGNRLALSAKVRVQSANGRVCRDCFTNDNFSGQAPSDILIGLGQASQADSVVIHWPSGHVTELRDIPANAALTIFEDDVVERREFPASE